MSDGKESEQLVQRMTRGWCIGSKQFKQSFSVDLLEQPEVLRLEGDELRELNRDQWETLLRRFLNRLGKSDEDVVGSKKSEQWKLAVAARLKRKTSVINNWLSKKLQMGAPNAVSDYCGKYARGAERNCPFGKKAEN